MLANMQSDELVMLTVRIPQSLKTRLAVYAAERQMAIQDIAAIALQEFLDARNPATPQTTSEKAA